jgi:hypothetical protein
MLAPIGTGCEYAPAGTPAGCAAGGGAARAAGGSAASAPLTVAGGIDIGAAARIAPCGIAGTPAGVPALADDAACSSSYAPA